jgi:hypothetical protein
MDGPADRRSAADWSSVAAGAIPRGKHRVFVRPTLDVALWVRAVTDGPALAEGCSLLDGPAWVRG